MAMIQRRGVIVGPAFVRFFDTEIRTMQRFLIYVFQRWLEGGRCSGRIQRDVPLGHALRKTNALSAQAEPER